MKNSNALWAVLLILPLVFACNRLESVTTPTGEGIRPAMKTVNLPENMDFPVEAPDLKKKETVIVTLSGEGIFIGEEAYSPEKLGERIKTLMADKPPDERIVYVNAGRELPHGDLVGFLDVLRTVDIDRAGLVVRTKDGNPHPFGIFEVKFPARPDPDIINKPNPLTLVVMRTQAGEIRLNNEPVKLEEAREKLSMIFTERENNGVFREGSNEIEKTGFIKADKDVSYEEVVKLIDAVKGAGAQPIGMRIDDLP
jgi:biopolymer transport protein ExbD